MRLTGGEIQHTLLAGQHGLAEDEPAHAHVRPFLGLMRALDYKVAVFQFLRRIEIDLRNRAAGLVLQGILAFDGELQFVRIEINRQPDIGYARQWQSDDRRKGLLERDLVLFYLRFGTINIQDVGVIEDENAKSGKGDQRTCQNQPRTIPEATARHGQARPDARSHAAAP